MLTRFNIDERKKDMNTRRVDYDQLAANFDHRYPPGEISYSGRALQDLAEKVNAKRILEVGCGTGHWLALLHTPDRFLAGVDLSDGMLAQARVKGVTAYLVQGAARELPVKSGEMDFIYCVNALHHFSSPETFISEAHRVLRSGGTLAILGSDFSASREDWYIYKYFEGVYKTDMKRFPPWKTVGGWLEKTGYEVHNLVKVEHICEHRTGADVLLDPFLQKHACSQLALLNEEAYQEGLSEIKSDLLMAEEKDQEIVFKSEIEIVMLSGSKLD